ncbi:MAG: metal ABC transporter substrate-binding protein [Candidatus Peribacteria bacterium]|nr:metal ABC transporter substrate-binding protein [Candidatus Peribacteria bacterium]
MWTSPTNAKVIAKKISDKLSELLPEQKEYFQNNLENFESELDTILAFFITKTE